MITTDDIQIADIESQLNKLRGSKGSSRSSNPCLFNLVVYAREPRRINYLHELIRTFVAKFPCRVFFIQGDDDLSSSFMEVGVSTEVVNTISSDLIRIHVTQNLLQRAPFVVFPNLVPDLPVFLLWGEDPTKDSILLPHLLTTATRIIFDSDTYDHLSLFSSNILELMKKNPSIAFVDINWIQTTGWRQILRKIFNSQEAIQQLRLNKGIKIFYNNRKEEWLRHNETQASYLRGWLSTQLKWKMISQDSQNGLIRFNYSNGSNEFPLTLAPKIDSNLTPGTILGFECTNDQSYSIMPVSNKLTVHISSAETCELPYTLPLANLKGPFPYVKELFFSPTGKHYQDMLKTFSLSKKKPDVIL